VRACEYACNMNVHTKFWSESPKGDVGVDGRILLDRIFDK
jgi:hypothetical protein